MDKQTDIIGMLELMTAPAFSVKDAKIDQLNQSAKQLMLEAGMPLSQLLPGQMADYQAFDGGCLFVTLHLSGLELSATVNRVGDGDIFIIDQQAQAELRIMSLVAQNLRMPLADVLNLTDQLLPVLEADAAPAQKKKIAQINRKLTQLSRIILNMADAPRYSADSGVYLVLQDAVAVIDEILERVQMLLEHTDTRLHIHLPQETILCQMDAEKLERAIYNLISNAVKASGPNGEIHLDVWQKHDRVHISVQDSGNGIPASILANIFTRYQRSAGLEDGRNGLGLGMVLVRAAAAVHGGTVLVQQPPAGGTKVTISIPIKMGNNLSVRSQMLFADYAGDRDHGLLELSEILPPELYTYNN